MGELPVISLSRREYEVLQLLRQGLAGSQITRKLGIRPATTYGYVRELAEKFEVRGALGVATKWATYDDRRLEVRAAEKRGMQPKRGVETGQVAAFERDRFGLKTLHNIRRVKSVSD